MLVISLIIIMAIVLSSLLVKSIARQSMQRYPYRKDPAMDKKNYLFSLFYYNPEDNRTLVPRISRKGFTVNIAKPAVMLVIMVITGWLVFTLK